MTYLTPIFTAVEIIQDLILNIKLNKEAFQTTNVVK